MDTSRVYRLAVLLPLDSRSTDRDEYNDRFYDFYTGLLTAVYQAQKAGMRLEIHTYDVPRTGNRLAEVLNDPWLETAHAIIGPAYTNQVNQTVAWNRTRAKWILVPFTSHVKGIENDPYILQFNPTSDRKARCLADTIEQHKDSLHCIYVKADRRPVQDVKYLLAELKEKCKVVELSHVVSPETPHWSGFPDMIDDTLYNYKEHGFYANTYTLVSQYGTHVDAPCHFVEGEALVAADGEALVVVLPGGEEQKLATGAGFHALAAGLGKVGEAVLLKDDEGQALFEGGAHHLFLALRDAWRDQNSTAVGL